MKKKNIINTVFIVLLIGLLTGCGQNIVDKSDELISAKNYEQALSLLNKEIYDNRENIEMYIRIGKCNLILDNYDEAYHAFYKARTLEKVNKSKNRKTNSKKVDEQISEITLSFSKEAVNDKNYKLLLISQNISFAFMLPPENIAAINELCFKEGGKLLLNGQVREAEILLKPAIDKAAYLTLTFGQTNNFIKEMLSFQKSSDSLFAMASYLENLVPKSSNFIISQIRQSNHIEVSSCLGRFIKNNDGNVWLLPKIDNGEENFKLFGLSSFSPIISYSYRYISKEQIESISSDAFYRSVQSNQLFYKENTVLNDFYFSRIPELSNIFSELRKKDKFQIAAAKDSVLKKIIQIKDIYVIPTLKYQTTIFKIQGNCFAFEDEYDLNAEVLLVHLFIGLPYDFSRQRYGPYVATVKIPFSLTEARNFFKDKQIIKGLVQYKLYPGTERVGLGYYVSSNSIVAEDPTITFENPNDTIIIKTTGLLGELWPKNKDNGSHYHAMKPNSRNVRNVIGVKVKK